jgi:hypothetical protein
MKSLLNLFKRKEEEYPFFVFAKLVEQVVPDERGRRYADPLAAYLEERGLGTVSGGGCLLADRAQPGEKDIEYAGHFKE